MLTAIPRKKGLRRDDKAVKICRELAVKAKIIAETRGVTAAEYLSNLLRDSIDSDWPHALKDLDRYHAAELASLPSAQGNP